MAVHTLRHTNTKLKREINFRHVVEPLNLLILMAEVFFSLSVCFFSFLFSWLLRVGLGPRLPGRHSDGAIYLSTSVASAPLSLLPSLPASCNSLLLYVCVSLSLSVSLITTHPEPLVFSWTGRDTETQEVGGGQKQKKFSLKYLITLFHAPSLLFLPVSVYLEVPVHNLG